MRDDVFLLIGVFGCWIGYETCMALDRDASMKFYEHLSSKAGPKPRSPPQSAYEEDLGQLLQAKLLAAEQKRQDDLARFAPEVIATGSSGYGAAESLKFLNYLAIGFDMY